MTDGFAPTPGLVVAGKYELQSMIGEGGMGSVWSAVHRGLGQIVAIKLISPAYAQSPEVRKRFDNEAKAAAKLKSKHVVQVFDNGELENGVPFIVMEMLVGATLAKRVHVHGPIPIAECVVILQGICKALSRAHGVGIIHRDIKPENIFLAQAEDEEGYVVKVLDFGVAKFSFAEEQQSTTRTGSLLGTPLYMSPEQARGLKSIDHRTDLYSLGLVAYTMLTGNLAWSGESFGDLIVQICTAPLPGMNQAAPWIPPSIDAWFARASARDPVDRFQSAREFSDAFAIAAGYLPGSWGPTETGAQLPRAQPVPMTSRNPFLETDATRKYVRQDYADGGVSVSPVGPSAGAVPAGQAAGPAQVQSLGGTGTDSISIPGTSPRRSPALLAVVGGVLLVAVVVLVVAISRKGSTSAEAASAAMVPSVASAAPVASATATAPPAAPAAPPPPAAVSAASTAALPVPAARTAAPAGAAAKPGAVSKPGTKPKPGGATKPGGIDVGF